MGRPHPRELEQLTANITLRTEDIPNRPITLPPIYTELSEIDVYTEMARLDLQYDDLRTDKPRTASLARLCKALCIGRYIALGNQPPLQYKSLALVCPMNFEKPQSEVSQGPAVIHCQPVDTHGLCEQVRRRPPCRSQSKLYYFSPIILHLLAKVPLV